MLTLIATAGVVAMFALAVIAHWQVSRHPDRFPPLPRRIREGALTPDATPTEPPAETTLASLDRRA